MSQGDIVSFFEKHDGWATAEQIAKASKVNRSTINTNLRRLERFGEVESLNVYRNGRWYKLYREVGK